MGCVSIICVVWPANPCDCTVAAHQRVCAVFFVISFAELDHWVDDPTDPRMLAADRRLAALTASLGSDSNAAMAAAMV